MILTLTLTTKLVEVATDLPAEVASALHYPPENVESATGDCGDVSSDEDSDDPLTF